VGVWGGRRRARCTGDDTFDEIGKGKGAKLKERDRVARVGS
jgi:hypothetical protein